MVLMKENDDGVPARTHFSSVLARLRREQGFATAHAFYKARGGRRAFGVAFTNYLGLERGRSLPKGRRLEVLVAALGLEPASRAARELVLAYLKDTLGSETLTRPFEVLPLPDPAPPGWQIAENAARQALGGRSRRLTPEQYALLARDEATYACHVADGTKDGYDIEITAAVAEAVNIPVVASGGAGSPQHLYEAVTKGHASAALAASIFHYGEYSIAETKRYLAERGVPMRL